MSTNKKAPDCSDAFLEEVVQKNWHPVYQELIRWREILATPYVRYKRVDIA